MGTIRNVEAHSRTEWLSAAYTDSAGVEYEAVFTRTYDYNSRCETREVVNIEKDEDEIASDSPLWKEIQEAVEAWETEDVEFTIKVGKEWLESLDSLIEQVLVCSPSSPEEALEAAIFSQIKGQRKAA